MRQTSIVEMLRNYWMEKLLLGFLLTIVAFLVYLSFGHSVYFDWLFILTLVAFLTIYKDNKDLFITLLLLLVLRGSSEFLFALADQSAFKWLYYVISILGVIKLSYDRLVKLLVGPVLILCLCAEIYWWLTAYSSPEIHFYILALVVNCYLRHFLSFKAHYKLYSNLELSNKPLDYACYKLNGVSNIVISILLIEYLIRHLTSYKPMFVYDVYSYIMQMISVYLFYLIVEYSVKAKFKLDA